MLKKVFALILTLVLAVTVACPVVAEDIIHIDALFLPAIGNTDREWLSDTEHRVLFAAFVVCDMAELQEEVIPIISDAAANDTIYVVDDGIAPSVSFFGNDRSLHVAYISLLETLTIQFTEDANPDAFLEANVFLGFDTYQILGSQIAIMLKLISNKLN